jgi:hypothetical protein
MYYAKSGFSLPTETATTVNPPQNNQRSTVVSFVSRLLILQPPNGGLVIGNSGTNITSNVGSTTTITNAAPVQDVGHTGTNITSNVGSTATITNAAPVQDVGHTGTNITSNVGSTATITNNDLSIITIGIIVGSCCGGVILISVAAYLFHRRCMSQQQSKVSPPAPSAPPLEMTMAPVHKLPAEAQHQSGVALPGPPRVLQQA